jgi:uncharacterized protein (DUF2235 family)
VSESFAAPNERSGRNLIICCDGTNNQFGPENTNVVRLVQILDRNPRKQRIYYDPGLGTLPEPGTWGKISQCLSKLAGLAFGAGINWKVAEAYTYLLNTWEPGDKVFLFGFSRGAYTARVLAGMLFAIGLLPRGCENLVPYALRLYKGVRDERKRGGITKQWSDLCDQFRWTFAKPVVPEDDKRQFPIHFLGVWDTVSSVGWVFNPEKFPYTARNLGLKTIRHAVSLDERRWFFRQNLMKQAGQQDLLEVWFPGVHCDIGGGYNAIYSDNPKTYSQLWRLPFNWMLREAKKCGLLVDQQRLQTVLESPAPPWQSSWSDPKHESLTGIWWLAEYCLKHVWNSDRQKREWHIGGGRSRIVPSGALIHSSVLNRLRERTLNYAPPNFSADFYERVNALSEVPETLEYLV